MVVEAGVDLIDISGGLQGSGRGRNLGQGYFAPLSHAIKEVADVPITVTGGVVSPEVAESIVREGKADLVGIGRALLAGPNWAVTTFQVLTG
ncbi:MAG: hypothetical protein PWR07_955 [Bacillota bacterium]|nr:hypothetical protein [Bacillota bacterium]